MHRQNSILPYHRHYTHSNLGFLDYFEAKEDGSVQGIYVYIKGKREKKKKLNHICM